ncbi:MAG: DUF1080 domain-containing protein [Bryobacteraceae bacterium]|nr:DUF1080 domain-containing protein [Bryobacteraceae bacterium]
MKHFFPIVLAFAAALIPAASQKTDSPFAGRWNMTVVAGDETYPSWMEVTGAAPNLQVRVQGRTGNVNPAAAVSLDGSRLIVTVVAAGADRPALVWELTPQGGKLTGVQKRGDAAAKLTGVRAPALKRPAPKAWTDPEPLFNGKDLTGWEPVNNTPGTKTAASYWTVENGELVNKGNGSNLRTTRTFDDFKLHVEYNCPPGENSGIYLRGRYEAQVTPPPRGDRPPSRPMGNPYLGIGSIYGMVGPSSPPPFKPDWQTYDITLVGRWVTVIFNGVTTIDNQEIPGITGGALDSNEGEPGPIYLQGDHHGGIRYRNITIALPKR